MKKPFVSIRLSQLCILAAIVTLLLAGSGCKSKKKALEAARAKTEQEEALRKQREEEARKREAEEMARREAEAKSERELKNTTSSNTHYTRLEQYFNAIATAPSVASANGSINEALSLFSSGDTPVLIVISDEGGQKDYDKPTTIREYLNYLKDQRKNLNTIGMLQFDDAGKIREVELIRKK